jgi:predicted ATP-dependent serine protease
LFFSFTELESRRVEKVLSWGEVGISGKVKEVGRGDKRVNIV